MRLEVDSSPTVLQPLTQAQFSNTKTFEASKEALNIGIRAAQSGDRVNARIALLRAAELDDRNENAWLWLASISEYPEELLAFLENVLAINPTNDRATQWMKATRSLLAKTFMQRGTDAAEADQPVYAEDCFLKSLEYDPENAGAWLWLASLSKEKEARMRHLHRVLEIEPENQAALNILNSIRSEDEAAEFGEIKKAAFEGDVVEALVSLENFNGRYPANSDAWMLRSHIEVRPADKLKALKRVLDIDPSHEAARLSLESLNAMFADAGPIDEKPEEPAAVLEEAPDEMLLPIEAPREELELATNDELAMESSSADPSDFDAVQASGQEIEGEDWNRETEAFDLSDLSKVSANVVVDAIPMPSDLPVTSPESFHERTGFETTVERPSNNSEDQTACPFCNFRNDVTSFNCGSCLAALSLSDLDALLTNSNADKYVIRKAVERMEKEKSSMPLDEAQLTMLGIGHLNLKNLQYGFNYLQKAASLNFNNTVLNDQVRALETRMKELRSQEESRAALVKGKTILVVDDSSTVRKLIAGKLEKSGHEVFCSNSGVEAMERLKDLTPDLILLDIAMPELDGYQVCRQIRGWVATANTPVVMISGKDGTFDKSKGEAAGSTGFITKPFGPETLMKAVEFYLAGGKDLDVTETNGEATA